MIASTPPAPYWAVIFTSLRRDGDSDAYAETARRMVELAREQEGFLGMESARDGLGITVSYWENPEAIRRWKENMEHLVAQENGKNRWYERYAVRVCKVERAYFFE